MSAGRCQAAIRPPGERLVRRWNCQDVDERVARDARAVMAQAREADQPMAEGGVGQRVGQDRLDVLLAARAVVAVGGVLGGDRLEVFEQIFDQPRTRALAALQWAAATRADIQTVLPVLIDPLGRRPAMAGMTVLGARAFAAATGSRRDVGLGVERPQAGQRAGCAAGGRLGLQFRDAPGGREQRRADGAGAERLELLRRGLIADGALQGRHQSVQRVPTRRGAARGEDIRPGALPAQRLNRKNLKKQPCNRVKCYAP